MECPDCGAVVRGAACVCGWTIPPRPKRSYVLARPEPSKQERAYGEFRLGLLKRVLAEREAFPALVAAALADWLDDAPQAAWARSATTADCGLHDGQHSLLHCLTDEVRLYQERAAGRSAPAQTYEGAHRRPRD